MANYTPRTKAPEEDNKYYKRTTEGGVNKCKYPLPNCVFYAWGRFYEILEASHNLSRGNAEDWYSNTADGYKRSDTPKLFAIACWKKGKLWNEKDGAGHVAVVEQVKANGDIVTSESVWEGARWRSKTYTKSSGYYLAKGYEFLGFILFPVDVEALQEKNVYTKGNYRVADKDGLNVRIGPGTKYRKKTYAEFTENAQKQIYELAGYKANCYVQGVEFTVSQVDGNWGKTPSGWVCLDYCTKI